MGENARLGRQLRRRTRRPYPPPSIFSQIRHGEKHARQTQQADTKGTTPPTTAPQPHAHVHTCRHKTPTKHPKTATRQTRKPRTPQGCQGNQEKVFNSHGAAQPSYARNTQPTGLGTAPTPSPVDAADTPDSTRITNEHTVPPPARARLEVST